MFFVTKRKVRRMLLQLMNSANSSRKAIEENPAASEQEKRDAFMFASGCIYCVCHALTALRGESDGAPSIRGPVCQTDEPREAGGACQEDGEYAEGFTPWRKES